MNRLALFAVVALMLVGTATIAHAGVIETASTRFDLVFSEGGFTTDGPTQVNGPSIYGDFDDFLFSSAAEGGNGGSSNAGQTSTIAPGNYSVNLDTRADAFGDGSDFASAYAESHFEVSFTLTSSEDFNISGPFGGAFGQINGETSRTQIIIESLGGGSPTQTILDETNDYPSFNVSGTLLPGDYKLTANSLSIVDRIFESGFGDANAGTVFNMTITPEPSSLGLVVLGSLSLIRRRRRA